jgi:hypothetical protein
MSARTQRLEPAPSEERSDDTPSDGSEEDSDGSDSHGDTPRGDEFAWGHERLLVP